MAALASPAEPQKKNEEKIKAVWKDLSGQDNRGVLETLTPKVEVMFAASSFRGQQVHQISRKHCLQESCGGKKMATREIYTESMRETE